MKIKFLFISIIIIAFSSCKTVKTLTKQEQKEQNTVLQLIEQVQKNQPQFNTANVKKMFMEVAIGERKVHVSATCKIKKDSAIYLSIQPFFGIEMFKAEFTTDSVRVFDKMNQRYYAADYAYIGNRFGVEVDFYSLQSLLTAQFFCIGQKNISSEACTQALAAPSGVRTIRFDTKNMVQETEITAKNTIQQVMLRDTKSNYKLQIAYADYLMLNGVNFPQKIALQLSGLKTNASCDFSIVKVDFNTDIQFIPTHPNHFTKADVNQLFKK